jgi:hypothetical protein
MSEIGEISRPRKEFSVIFPPKADGYLQKNITPETLDKKIEDLTEAGFKNPIELIGKFPRLAGLDIQRVKKDLIDAGFKNPNSLIEKFPPITSYNIQQVKKDLTGAGFKNPNRLIGKRPRLASLDIQRVIQDLTKAGFGNPVGLIEKFPQSAELNIDKIKQKLELIRSMNMQFGINYDPVEVIESCPQYLSYSKLRIYFYLRVASLLPPNEKLYKRLIMNNPFLFFSLLSENIPNDEAEMGGMISRCIKLNGREKDTRIRRVKENLPQILKELKEEPENERTKFLSKLAINLLRQTG